MRSVLLIGIMVLIGMSSCDQKPAEEREVSTDLINNPATASDDEVDPENVPAFEFEEEVISFGKISQGEKVKRRFVFTNVGKTDLIISDAKGSCGCTVPLWPKKPIKPGEQGEIEVVFDSNNQKGKISKSVTLVANTLPNTKVIRIKGEVLTPKENQKEQ